MFVAPIQVACDLSPANARAPISEAADSEDEEFLEEEQLEEEEASPGLATLLVQFDVRLLKLIALLKNLAL